MKCVTKTGHVLSTAKFAKFGDDKASGFCFGVLTRTYTQSHSTYIHV